MPSSSFNFLALSVLSNNCLLQLHHGLANTPAPAMHVAHSGRAQGKDQHAGKDHSPAAEMIAHVKNCRR
jgi:hypothetical protein